MRSEEEAEKLEALLRGHSVTVLKYALRRGATLEEAEDVVSETFIVAFRRLKDIPEDLVSWLVGVARRLLANEWRGKHRWTVLTRELKFAGRDFATPFRDPVEAVEERESVGGALSRLPEWDREAQPSELGRLERCGGRKGHGMQPGALRCKDLAREASSCERNGRIRTLGLYRSS